MVGVELANGLNLHQKYCGLINHTKKLMRKNKPKLSPKKKID